MMTNGSGPSLPRAAPPHGATLASVLVLSAIVAALLVSAVVLWRFSRATDARSGLSERFELNLDPYLQVDPALIQYQQTAVIPVGLETVRALAVGPEDRMYVAGDRAVAIFDAAGRRVQQLAVEGEPACVAVAGAEAAGAGSVYVGVGNRIERFGPDGSGRAAWNQGFNENTVLTSLAVADEELFAADAGNRVVWRINLRGELRGKIGAEGDDEAVGFIIPSAYFDVAVTADGLLRVANPGAQRIETFTSDGHRLGQWGQASADIEGFFGCCNPANFAVLPDGRFVTVEKGIPRVKVYSRDGKFECVVAAPQTLVPTAAAVEETREEHQVNVFDVAADSRGRVLVLDPTAKTIRVFERKSP